MAEQFFVNNVFTSVASKYDIMNDLMSLGIHRIWKKHFINNLKINADTKLIDFATGSGDIAMGIFKKYKPKQKIIMSDINAQMLAEAKSKLIDQNLFKNFELLQVNMENTGLADASFDIATIAFGIRNVENRDNAYKQMLRILKTDGKFYILEFSTPPNANFKKLYDLYSKFIPGLGKLIAGDKDSYQYLVDSIKAFPDAETLKLELLSAGFTKVTYELLSGGIVAIHCAEK